MKEDAKDYRPPLWVCLATLAFMLAGMGYTIFISGYQNLHITMLVCMGFCVLLLILTGCPYSRIEKAVIQSSSLIVSTVLILYTIGAVMGSWIASGTVPLVIYWGLKIINPHFFLLTACIASAITALATGSSWSTAGTVGVALMGVGMGLGINPAMTAGAVVSGAAFGDKLSPLSDNTNVAPAVAGSDIFDHIRANFYTSIPALAATLIGFTILGITHDGNADSETIDEIITSLDSIFNLNIVAVIPIILVLILAFRKMPALYTLLISALVAALIAIFVQGQSLGSIMQIIENGFVSTSGFADVDKLLTRGGMFAMHYTASLTVIVVAFGGIMEKCGILDEILSHMEGLTRTVGTTVLTTVLIEVILNLVTASQYMTVVLGGKLMMPVFKKKDLLPQCLSRTLVDSGTVTSPLIPWNLCGAFISSALGVGCFQYLPFALFCWICPLVAIIFAFLGKFQWKTGEIPSKRTYRDPEVEVAAL